MPVAEQKCGPYFPDLHVAVRRKRQEGERMWMTSFPLFRLRELHLGVGVRPEEESKGWDGMEQEGEYSSSTHSTGS